jgi:4-amino-4-deoxy-L-arabinose transferase-like glycosyltransferase
VVDDEAAPSPVPNRIDPDSGTSRLIVAPLVLAAIPLYGWGLTRGAPHIYYSAAVRSMSLNWHNFAYGALDPGGTVTVDKVPGWLWIHALFVRAFGLHDWVLLLPEMLAAAGTVPLLYGAVRRSFGDRAAVWATVGYLCAPATFITAQVNLPDTLLVLCVVAAAYTLIRAWQRTAWRALLASAVLLGLAFQMKMLEALLVLPAFALAYLIGAGGGWPSRLARTAGYAVVTLLVSASWMIAVALTPAGARPAVDGSGRNSVWDMVLVYNGIDRGRADAAILFGGNPGTYRLFNDQVGGELSWLLPMAVAMLAAGLYPAWISRDRGRIAGWVLWGGWLALVWAAFNRINGMNPYYTVLLAPAVGAVIGGGLPDAYRAWCARRPVGWLLPGGLATSAAWGAWLILRRNSGLGWLAIVVVAAASGAVALLLIQRAGGPAIAARAGSAAPLAVGISVFAAPAVWMLATPAMASNPLQWIDPVAGPSAVQAARLRATGGSGLPVVDPGLLGYLTTHDSGTSFLFAAGNAGTAAPYLLAGYDVLPLRGFSAQGPEVPVARLQDLVRAGRLRYLLLIDRRELGPTDQALTGWVRDHCGIVARSSYAAASPPRPWDPTLHDCHA